MIPDELIIQAPNTIFSPPKETVTNLHHPLLRPFNLNITRYEPSEHEDRTTIERWLDSWRNTRNLKLGLKFPCLEQIPHSPTLNDVLPFFLDCEGYTNTNHLFALQMALKMAPFDILPSSAKINEHGGSLARIADTSVKNPLFLGHLPVYLKQEAHRFLQSSVPDNPTEQLACKVLEQMLTLGLNTDHFLPICLSEFPKVYQVLTQTVIDYLDSHNIANSSTIIPDGVCFTVKDKDAFFAGLEIPATSGRYKELKPYTFVNLLQFDDPRVHAYRIEIKKIRPAGNSDWELYGVLGGPIDKNGNPVWFNLKYFFSPSVYTNPNLIPFDQREYFDPTCLAGNVSKKQTLALAYYKKGLIELPEVALDEMTWFYTPNHLPALYLRSTLMSRLSPIIRWLKDWVFVNDLDYCDYGPLERRRSFEKENFLETVKEIEVMQKEGQLLNEREKLEYYADLILMATRDPFIYLYYIKNLSPCLKWGEIIKKIEFPEAAVYRPETSFFEIAYPYPKGSTNTLSGKRLLCWDVDPTPIDHLVELAEQTAQQIGIEMFESGLSPLAKFIILFEPGVPLPI